MSRIRLLVVVVMTVVAIGFMGLSSAKAAPTPPWYDCTIDQVGSGEGYNFVWLSEENGAFSGVQFFLNYNTNQSVKELLATALTAKSNNQTVNVYLTGTTDGNVVIYMFAK